LYTLYSSLSNLHPPFLALILHPQFFTLHPSTFSLTVEVGV
jgi:hypothetical protein